MRKYRFPLFSLPTERSPLEAALGAKASETVLTRHTAVDAVIDFANGVISPLVQMQEQTRDQHLKRIESYKSFVRDKFGRLKRIVDENGISAEGLEEFRLAESTEPREKAIDKSVLDFLHDAIKENIRPTKGLVQQQEEAELKKIDDEEVPYMQRDLDSIEEEVESYRVDANEMLTLAAESADDLLTYVSELTSSEGRSEINIAPVLVKSKEKWVPDWQLMGPSHHPHPWIYFAGFVLAEDAAKTGKTNIHVCKWEQCGRFFRTAVNGKRGKPATEYCPGTDHRERARPKSTDRVDRYRKRKKAEAAAKRVRKHR